MTFIQNSFEGGKKGASSSKNVFKNKGQDAEKNTDGGIVYWNTASTEKIVSDIAKAKKYFANLYISSSAAADSLKEIKNSYAKKPITWASTGTHDAPITFASGNGDFIEGYSFSSTEDSVLKYVKGNEVPLNTWMEFTMPTEPFTMTVDFTDINYEAMKVMYGGDVPKKTDPPVPGEDCLF
jgi:hypothetical protein